MLSYGGLALHAGARNHIEPSGEFLSFYCGFYKTYSDG